MIKRLLIWIVTVFCVIGLGVLLISVVFIIDTENLEKNLNDSKALLKSEDIRYQPDGTEISTLDNYTDSLMLLIASYRGNESILDKGMNIYRFYREDTSPYDQLTIEDETTPMTVISYYRYWHGYLVFLRPLLAIFNYSQIRKINAVMQIVVFLILLLLMIKNKIGIYVISFISCYILMCPVALSMSLQNSTVWYISCISCIIYLLWKEKITKYKLHYLLFTIVGMVTSFMDLLTYPIVSLGMLLLFVLISEELDFKEAVKRILICGICWTLGYGIMWGAKWVIGTLVIGENVIQQALNQASYRSSNLTWGDVEVSRIGVIKNTLQMFHLPMTKKIILFHGICCLSIVLINLKKYHVKEMKKRIMDVLPIYAVGLMTFVWYLVLTNHTQIHPFLAFRTAFVFIFAVTVGTYKLIS